MCSWPKFLAKNGRSHLTLKKARGRSEYKLDAYTTINLYDDSEWPHNCGKVPSVFIRWIVWNLGDCKKEVCLLILGIYTNYFLMSSTEFLENLLDIGFGNRRKSACFRLGIRKYSPHIRVELFRCLYFLALSEDWTIRIQRAFFKRSAFFRRAVKNPIGVFKIEIDL